MLRNRPRPSRANPTTTCQKCLRKGHYSYECTSSVQERPYASRASRTQQLANPKLKPKLTETVPEEFLQKKEETKTAETRVSAPRDIAAERPTKRARSASYSSVSTISTRASRSHSRSPQRSSRMDSTRDSAMDGIQASFTDQPGRKRGRSISTSPSVSGSPPSAAHRTKKTTRDERNTRRRHSSISPAPRGRALYGDRGRGYSSEFDSDATRSSDISATARKRRKDSMDRSRVAKERASYAAGDSRRHKPTNDYDRDERIHSARYGQDQNAGRTAKEPTANVQRKRSLSPYSKRLQLTQAMTGGSQR